MDLIVENVRCFAGRHVAPLAPLTILVGENSSGKSTLIAMARLAWDAMNQRDAIVDFNEEPFRLGAFDDIITTNALGKADTFTIGFRFPTRTADNRRASTVLADDVEVLVTFSGRDAQPVIREWTIRCGRYAVTHTATTPGDDQLPSLVIDVPSTKLPVKARDFPEARSVMAVCRFWNMFRAQMKVAKKWFDRDPEGDRVAPEDLDALGLILGSIQLALRSGRPYASAPIRTKPIRTYDPLTDRPTPEGDHVPMMLAKLMGASPSHPNLQPLLDGLHRFGNSAGLFASIDVRRMGGNEASLPFQIRVGTDAGPKFNLVDVGYGVSQVLPVLVDALMNRGKMLLLQQPEVHLHPKAQAELGSFLGQLAKEHVQAPILIETHSDYLLDRVRMDIRDNRGVTSKDVVILYCTRTAGGASISPIRIDDQGNLVGAPPDYRDFFLAEERRFLQS